MSLGKLNRPAQRITGGSRIPVKRCDSIALLSVSRWMAGRFVLKSLFSSGVILNNVKDLLLLLLLSAFFFPLSSFADTTFVSGAVSGEWTRDGNPYIVVDSTWVPEGERLTLTAGVEAFFNEGQGLYVFGTMNAEGRENDSVRIRVSGGVESWKGIRYYNRNRTQWDFASIVCPDTAIGIDPGYALTVNNSLLDAWRPIAGLNSDFGISRCSITINRSDIISSASHSSTGGRLIANHSTFDFESDPNDEPGFWSSGCSYHFTSCTVVGSLFNFEGSAVIDSCRWLQFDDGRRIGVAASGIQARMTETYVEGSAGASGSNGSVAIFRNNTVLHHASFTSCSPRITGCMIGRQLYLSECGSSTISNVVAGGVGARNSGVTIVDSCSFNLDGSEYLSVFSNTTNLTVKHSLMRMSIGIDGDVDEFHFDHNTLIFDENNDAISATADSSWTNNIFLSLDPDNRLFTSENIPSVRYNCFWGFDYVGGPIDNPMRADSTNIFLDPRIVWEDSIPYLDSVSPCIDRGDPNSPLDSDRTRSDIGARAFSHIVSAFEKPNEIRVSFLLNAMISPNPFNGFFNVSFSTSLKSPASAQLFDQSGRAVMPEFNLPASIGMQVISINAVNVPSGSYFLLLRNNQVTKLIPVHCIK